MQAHGGSGKYAWLMASSNRVASVNDSGWLTPQAFGTTTVIAQDAAKTSHSGHAQVVVEKPHRLAFVPGVREVSNNHTLRLAVQFFNADGQPYQHCHHLRPKWTLKSESQQTAPIFKILDDSVPTE